MVIFQTIFSNMVILNMVIFSDIQKYGNMPYGNIFDIITIFQHQNMVKKKTYATEALTP